MAKSKFIIGGYAVPLHGAKAGIPLKIHNIFQERARITFQLRWPSGDIVSYDKSVLRRPVGREIKAIRGGL